MTGPAPQIVKKKAVALQNSPNKWAMARGWWLPRLRAQSGLRSLRALRCGAVVVLRTSKQKWLNMDGRASVLGSRAGCET